MPQTCERIFDSPRGAVGADGGWTTADASSAHSHAASDRNLLWHPPHSGDSAAGGSTDFHFLAFNTFASWQALPNGWDANSKVGDPLFVDRASGNYSLKPGSPAFALGFEQIPAIRAPFVVVAQTATPVMLHLPPPRPPQEHYRATAAQPSELVFAAPVDMPKLPHGDSIGLKSDDLVASGVYVPPCVRDGRATASCFGGGPHAINITDATSALQVIDLITFLF